MSLHRFFRFKADDFISENVLLNRLIILIIVFSLISIFIIYFIWESQNKVFGRFPGTKLNPFMEMLVILMLYFQNKHLDANTWNFQILSSWANVYRKQGIFRTWVGVFPVVSVYRADFFEAILSSNVNIHKGIGYSYLKPWMKDNLLTSSGAKWRGRRKLLTPSFHFRILEEFCPIFNEHSYVMLDILKRDAEKEWIDLVPLITRCTLDIICETSMGINLNCQTLQDRGYLKNLEKLGESFSNRAVKPWLWADCIYKLTSAGKSFFRHAEGLLAFAEQVFKEKKEEYIKKSKHENCDENENQIPNGQKKRRAFMDLMLHHYFENQTLTEEEVLDEVNLFIFGGHDTTAYNVIWTLYLLGRHPDIQKKVQDELDSVYGDDVYTPVLPEDLKHLKYLDCVVKEALRLFPSIPFMGRQLLEDVHVDGHHIPRGTLVMLFIYQLHRDPEAFQNPEKFDPDRFLPENSVNRNPYQYVPYSAGPRNCIGQKYGQIEARVLVAQVFRHFTLKSLDPRDRVPLGGELVLRPKVPLRVKVIPRR